MSNYQKLTISYLTALDNFRAKTNNSKKSSASAYRDFNNSVSASLYSDAAARTRSLLRTPKN